MAGKDQPAAMVLTRGLTSFGEFGPLLSAVLLDLPQGKLAWSHWEQESAKPVAVFGFSVPKAASDYEVKFCCVGGSPFVQFTGYHGEITINPEDGAILRLTLLADLAKDDPSPELILRSSTVRLSLRDEFTSALLKALRFLLHRRARRARGRAAPAALMGNNLMWLQTQ